MMRKSTHRYIAIAFGVAMLPITAIELLMGGFPVFGVICLAGAKQFYDNSLGKVFDPKLEENIALRMFNDPKSPHHIDNDYNGPRRSAARGEHSYGGGPFFTPHD